MHSLSQMQHTHKYTTMASAQEAWDTRQCGLGAAGGLGFFTSPNGYLETMSALTHLAGLWCIGLMLAGGAFPPWRVLLSLPPVYIIYSFTIVSFFEFTTYAYAEPPELFQYSFMKTPLVRYINHMYQTHLITTYLYVKIKTRIALTLLDPEPPNTAMYTNAV